MCDVDHVQHLLEDIASNMCSWEGNPLYLLLRGDESLGKKVVGVEVTRSHKGSY